MERPGNEKGLPFTKPLAVSEQLSKLTEGIAFLDKELQKQVLEKHEDLVSQATWVEKLQGVLSVMHVHIQSLLSSVERVRMKVVDPFSKVESQTNVLSRLHATSDLLRRAVRIQLLVKRLPSSDPFKAAHVLSELSELYKDVDLSGLDMLEYEERLIKKETVRVEIQSQKMIEQGLVALEHEQVGTGFEVLMKLGIAEREVTKLLERCLKQVEASIDSALDMNNLVPISTRGGAGRVVGSNIPANIQNFRMRLWGAWEQVLVTVYTACAHMALIQNVLNSKGCLSISYMSGSSKSCNSEIAMVFWNQADGLISSKLAAAAKGSTYIKQALELEYPKLLWLHLDLHKKLKALDQKEGTGGVFFPSIGHFGKQFETAYLSRSVMYILDSVRDMFPESEYTTNTTPPSIERVDILIKTISSELSVSLVDENLANPVSRNIEKAVSLFCQKGEQMMATGTDATQVIETSTNAQSLNVSIANIVFYLCEQVKNVLNNLGLNKAASNNILSALDHGYSLIKQILKPILDSITVAIEAIISSMHSEDFNIKEFSGSSSLYMKELQRFIGRAVSNYLAPFHCQQIVSQSCLGVASRTLEVFMRHASFVRPLSEAGRKKLVADFKMIEECISPLCGQLSELGSIYSSLRSMRPLIVAPPQEVASSPVLGHVIPFSLALTLLFSRAPPELPSPHESLGWSVSQLSEWLDKHNCEKDRLELIKGSLHKYEKLICKENKSEFHTIYPIMTQLLEKAFQTHIP